MTGLCCLGDAVARAYERGIIEEKYYVNEQK